MPVAPSRTCLILHASRRSPSSLLNYLSTLPFFSFFLSFFLSFPTGSIGVGSREAGRGVCVCMCVSMCVCVCIACILHMCVCIATWCSRDSRFLVPRPDSGLVVHTTILRRGKRQLLNATLAVMAADRRLMQLLPVNESQCLVPRSVLANAFLARNHAIAATANDIPCAHGQSFKYASGARHRNFG